MEGGVLSLFFYARNLSYGVRLSGLCAYVDTCVSSGLRTLCISLVEVGSSEVKYPSNMYGTPTRAFPNNTRPFVKTQNTSRHHCSCIHQPIVSHKTTNVVFRTSHIRSKMKLQLLLAPAAALFCADPVVAASEVRDCC